MKTLLLSPGAMEIPSPKLRPEPPGRQLPSLRTLPAWCRPDAVPLRWRRVVSVAVNLVGAVGAFYFANATLHFYLRTHRLIGAVFFAEQMWVVIAYLVRRRAQVVSVRTGDWLLAFAGTFGGVLFRPEGAHLRWGIDVGLGLQVAGLAICIASFLALGRSFGFAAADRGLKVRGPYAVVRHPIYASYLVLQLGYVLQSLSVRNAVVMAVVTACNVGRTRVEDRVLAGNEGYRAYRARVPWKYLPHVW